MLREKGEGKMAENEKIDITKSGLEPASSDESYEEYEDRKIKEIQQKMLEQAKKLTPTFGSDLGLYVWGVLHPLQDLTLGSNTRLNDIKGKIFTDNFLQQLADNSPEDLDMETWKSIVEYKTLPIKVDLNTHKVNIGTSRDYRAILEAIQGK